MKSTMVIASVALLFLIFAGSSALGSTQVETFTGSIQAAVNLPGTEIGGDSPLLQFEATGYLTSISFTPGYVMFEGASIDFHGTESSWLSSTFQSTAIIPEVQNQSVHSDASFTVSGAANISGNADTDNLDLGENFNISNFDLVSQGNLTAVANVAEWSSSAVPGLNGYPVYSNASETVTSVDAVNGIVTAYAVGEIWASPIGEWPTLSMWGLIILGIGIMGMGINLIRHSMRHAGGAAA